MEYAYFRQTVYFYEHDKYIFKKLSFFSQALYEMRSQYCGPDNSTAPEPKLDDDECDLNEINTARDWM